MKSDAVHFCRFGGGGAVALAKESEIVHEGADFPGASGGRSESETKRDRETVSKNGDRESMT